MTTKRVQNPLVELFLGGLMLLGVIIVFMWIFKADIHGTAAQLDCSPSNTYIK